MEAESPSSVGFKPALRALGKSALDLLYPERCVHCGRFGASVCAECLQSISEPAGVARCPFCHARWPGPDNCPRCYRWDALDGAAAVTDYEGVARDMVRALKYRRTRSVASVMAERLHPLLDVEQADFVFPIPLHRSRLRSRGFNQAELVARRLDLSAPPGSLVRRRRTRPQFGLSHAERAHNVAGAFGYRGPALNGARILVLDDVITTGATVNECARVLRDAGAASVRALAFARASYEPAPEGFLLEL